MSLSSLIIHACMVIPTVDEIRDVKVCRTISLAIVRLDTQPRFGPHNQMVSSDVSREFNDMRPK